MQPIGDMGKADRQPAFVRQHHGHVSHLRPWSIAAAIPEYASAGTRYPRTAPICLVARTDPVLRRRTEPLCARFTRRCAPATAALSRPPVGPRSAASFACAGACPCAAAFSYHARAASGSAATPIPSHRDRRARSAPPAVPARPLCRYHATAASGSRSTPSPRNSMTARLCCAAPLALFGGAAIPGGAGSRIGRHAEPGAVHDAELELRPGMSGLRRPAKPGSRLLGLALAPVAGKQVSARRSIAPPPRLARPRRDSSGSPPPASPAEARSAAQRWPSCSKAGP